MELAGLTLESTTAVYVSSWQLVTDEPAKMVEKTLDGIWRKFYGNAPSNIQFAVSIVAEQVGWDLLRSDIIRKRLDGHVAKLYDTEAAANGLWKKLLS